MSKTVLITGASRGIGAEMARRYAAAGDTVIGTYRSQAPDIPGVIWAKADVTDRADLANLRGHIPNGKLDLLVANAGVYLDRPDDVATGYDPALWQATMAANVMAPFLSVQAVLPELEAAKPSAIAFISSRMGSSESVKGNSLIYRSSKAACANVAKNLSVELAPKGIAVAAYHPGWVRTDMGGSAADIDVETSAAGLIQCFAGLDATTTGGFFNYDGSALPY